MPGALDAAVSLVRVGRRPVAAGRPRAWVWLGGAAVLLGVALVTGALVGPAGLAPGGILRELLSHMPFLHVGSGFSATEDAIFWELRLPRVILGCLVGAMLSGAGAAYQGVFRNPLADPYLLGVGAGAGLGATLIFAYGSSSVFGSDLLPLAAFAGGSLAVVLAYVMGRTGGTAALILAGVTITSFFTAVQTFVQQQNSETLQAVYSWILGRVDTAGWHDVLLLLPYAGVSALALLLHARHLDVLTLGDDEAASLGVDVRRLRLVIVIAATLATAGAVSVSGLIGFLGIIVPHVVRLLVGASYRLVLPLSLVGGGAFLVFADVLARTVISPAELPIGVVTAFFGAPFFAVILRTSKQVVST